MMQKLPKILDDAMKKAFDAGYVLGYKIGKTEQDKSREEEMTYDSYLIKKAVIQHKLFSISKRQEREKL